jgi:hypothetical protein
MPATAGTYEYRLFAAGGYTRLATSSAVTVAAPPTVSSFSPTSGPLGTSVVIIGTNLSSASSVKFNGATATFSIASATQITAFVPGTATTGTIAVTTPYGTGTSAGAFTVTAGTATTVSSSLSAVAVNGVVTVSWSGVAAPNVGDWVAIAHPSDANTTYTSFKYTSSCTTSVGATALASGSCSYTMPATAGTYEVRLFANSASPYTRLATSGVITVS